MDKIKYLTQQEYDNVCSFKSLKGVYRKFRRYRCNPYGLKRSAKGFTAWKYVDKAFKDIKKANYNPDTIYFVMSE